MALTPREGEDLKGPRPCFIRNTCLRSNDENCALYLSQYHSGQNSLIPTTVSNLRPDNHIEANSEQALKYEILTTHF